MWHSALPGPLLTRLYFKAAKLHAEKSEAEENLEDYLEALQAALNRISPSDPLRKHAETISDKLPLEWREHMKRKSVTGNQMSESELDEKALVRLHRQVKEAYPFGEYLLFIAIKLFPLSRYSRSLERYSANGERTLSGATWLRRSSTWKMFTAMSAVTNATLSPLSNLHDQLGLPGCLAQH